MKGYGHTCTCKCTVCVPVSVVSSRLSLYTTLMCIILYCILHGGHYYWVINFTNFANAYHFAEINSFNSITFREPRLLYNFHVHA